MMAFLKLRDIRHIAQIFTMVCAVLSTGMLLSSKSWAQGNCAVQACYYYDCYFCQTISVPALENAVTSAVSTQHSTTQNTVTNQHSDSIANMTRYQVTLHHKRFRAWFSSEFFQQSAAPHLQDFANQMTTMSQAAVMAVGSFFDAQNHIQSQLLLSKLKAQAHKDYQVSSSVCNFGTLSASLAHSDSVVDATKSTLSQWYMDRITGQEGSSGSSSEIDDLKRRTEQFKSTYCNPQDNNNRLGSVDTAIDSMCGSGAVEPRDYNNDINYASIINDPLTLSIDFNDNITTDDEEDIFALARNLYSSRLLERTSSYMLTIKGNKSTFLSTRELFAKRNIANNTFNTIVGMKTPSGVGLTASPNVMTAEKLTAITEFLGLPADLVETTIGTNPSYYAQMEFLTRKLYQSPLFYNNLVDTPVNVERQQAAMQAYELMQTRDLYESLVRSEMLVSTLLETTLRKNRGFVDKNLRILRAGEE